MKTATITQAKNQLSALIDRVRHGETIIITDRGRPVALLVSALIGAAEDPEGRLARLERRGGLRRATASPPRSLILRKVSKVKKPSGVLEALLEERREGRLSRNAATSGRRRSAGRRRGPPRRGAAATSGWARGQ